MGFRKTGLEAERFRIMVYSLLGFALARQHIPQIIVRPGITRPQPKRFCIVLKCLIEALLIDQSRAQVIMGFRKTGLEAERFRIMVYSLLGFALARQHI